MRVRATILAARRNGWSSRAFTVVELLVVVAIIAILVALIQAGFNKARTMARTASCLANQRQIALAQSSYATDNNGAYASPRTSLYATVAFTYTNSCGSFPFTINLGRASDSTYHSWTASYGSGLVGGTEFEYGINSTNPAARALSGGRLYPYIGSAAVYRSPGDPSSRLRSYSLCGFVGVTTPGDNPTFGQTWNGWFCAQGVTPHEWMTTHVRHIKMPSQTLMTIGETDGTAGLNYNDQGWMLDPRPPSGTPAPMGAPNPGAWGTTGGWTGWIDSPAFWDPKNITYSYADGSTEVYSLQNTKLPGLIEGPPGGGYGGYYPQPADNLSTGPWRRDFMHFRDRLLPGVFPPMMPRHTGE